MAANPKLKVALVFWLLGAISLHLVLYWMVRADVVDGLPDFSIFYTAGLIVKRGQAHQLYDSKLQQEVQREFTADKATPLPYNHPPFEALLYVPLTYFSYLHAYFLWVIINLLLLLQICRSLRPYVPTLTGFLPSWPWLMGLGFFPCFFALMQAQDSILLLLLYTGTFVFLRSGREFRAGAVLALGLFKFHLVLPFVFILLLRRRWRFGLGFALIGSAVFLLSAALTGWNELLYYPHYLLEINQLRPLRVIIPRNMPNLRGLISGWPWQVSALWLDGATLVGSLGLLVWSAAQWRVRERKNLLLWSGGFSIALVASFLTCYQAYNQDMSIVLLPALLLFDQWLDGPSASPPSRSLALALFVLFLSPLQLILTLHYQQENLFCLALIVFAAAIAQWMSALQGGRLAESATV